MQLSLLQDDAPELPDFELDQRIATAIEAIAARIRAGHPMCCAYSGGKDSSVTLSLLLTAAAEVAAAGGDLPPICVLHGNTKMEQPEVALHVHLELEKAKDWAWHHNVDLRVEVAEPSVANEFWVRVIAGLKLPSFPGMNHDCTDTLKIAPMRRLRERVLKELGGAEQAPITLLGTRSAESEIRARRMAARNETSIPVQNNDGDWIMAPICEWSDDDVWEYLGSCRAGEIPAYSDFDETFRIYADAGASSCAVVADLALQTVKRSRPCGTRTGCWGCTPIGESDKSMENLLANDARYGYMRPLNALRNFLFATRWDFSRRYWIGKTVEEGYLCVRPDVYSPAQQRELLRYALTIDLDERRAAARAGLAAPRFQILSMEALIAIDCYWSMNGMQRPFEALKIYRDIVEDGQRFPVPTVETSPRAPLPEPRFIRVGDDWDEGRFQPYSGMRDYLLEEYGGDGCQGTRTLSNGEVVLNVDVDEVFSVDAEGLEMLIGFELDYLIDTYWQDAHVGSSRALLTYLHYGTVRLAKGQEGRVHDAMKRTGFRARHGLCGDLDLEQLKQRSVSVDAVPPEVVAAFVKTDTQRQLISVRKLF